MIHWWRILAAGVLSEVGVIATLLVSIAIYKARTPALSREQTQALGERIGYYGPNGRLRDDRPGGVMGSARSRIERHRQWRAGGCRQRRDHVPVLLPGETRAPFDVRRGLSRCGSLRACWPELWHRDCSGDLAATLLS